MEDPNLIACLYPANRDTEAAIRMPENSGRYIPAQRPSASEHGSRESTVSVGDEENNDDDLLSQHRLQLTFNQGPKAGQGLVIGHDRNRCDIVLPKLRHISGRHCVLTFDAKRRLILRDLSRNGTIVEYDGQGGEKRRTIITYDDKRREKRHHFTWILSGEEVPKDVQKIVIRIEDIKFQIIVPKHETYPDLYNDHVDRFLREANANDDLPFGALGIQSTTSTTQQSGAHTPTHQMPIYINQWRLGSGQFSIVNRVWDVSTGSVYASKEIFNMTKTQWRREARIMDQVSRLSNDHIVRLVTFIETPSPRLILEYLPCGNLEDQHKYHRFSYQESLTILCQSLAALTSVHENDIVHRDIKPANILVLSRNPLHIKLGDFGVSKATTDLQTFCGTPIYAAPEIYTTRRSEYYTKACDIWSLGVIVFNYAYGPLPNFHRKDEGLAWCKMIIKQVNDWDSDNLVDFLSTAMLIIEPDDRLSSRECWEQALQLSAPSQSRCPTPTQASYSASDWLQEISDPHRATPSATPTEVATFISMKARQDNNPSMQDEGIMLRTPLPPPEAPKNLSTRSLRSDREGLVYVVIRRHAVAMRLSDYKLNASEICNAAGLNKSNRLKYLHILKSRNIVTVEKNKHFWVPFQDGVFLCQALKLAGELDALFSKAPMNIPPEGENYFLSHARQKVRLPPEDYAILQWNEVDIVYNPSNQTVNATHLIKLGTNINRATLGTFLSSLETPKTIIRGGNSKAQGSYISLERGGIYARQLCQYFRLSQDPIEELLARIAPAPAMGPVADAAPRTLDNGLVADESEYWPHSPAAPASTKMDGTRPASYDGATHYDYTYVGSFTVGSLGDRETRSAAPPVPHSDLPTDTECGEAVADPDSYSQYTESNYEHGSYLAPANRSYLQLCMDNTA